MEVNIVHDDSVITEYNEFIRLVVDRDNDVWFCPTRESVYMMAHGAYYEEKVSFKELCEEYGPIRPFRGTVTLNN